MSGAVVARDICFFASEIGKFSPLVWNGFLRNSAYLLNSELEWAFCLGLIEKKIGKAWQRRSGPLRKNNNQTKQAKLQFLNKNSSSEIP